MNDSLADLMEWKAAHAPEGAFRKRDHDTPILDDPDWDALYVEVGDLVAISIAVENWPDLGPDPAYSIKRNAKKAEYDAYRRAS